MNCIRGSWGWQLLVSTLIVGGVVTSGNCALGQVVGDTTLGAESSVVTPNVNINGLPADRIDGGATRGANLFHSFLEFNVGNGQQVYFSNPPGIENIFSRVTGTDPSDILGTLGVTGNANLFLVNPNGIIFGRNASLDVGGSFYATTASGIQFGNRGQFSATNPQPPSSLLTINPSAFFFTARANQGAIITQSQATQTVQGTPTDGLQVPNGQTLLLLGGNVTVDGGLLNAWGGRVEIGAVAGTGTVGLNANGSLSVPEGMPRADVAFTNGILSLPDPMQRADVIGRTPFALNKRAGVDVRLDRGGDINITAGNISILDGSQLRAGIATGLGTTGSRGGEISVNATGEIRMSGDDGRIANDIRRNATGKAGDIQVTARSLVVLDGAQLSASTFGVGDAGNVVIKADQVTFRGARTDELGPSAAFSRVETRARGKGGTVQIFTNVLEVTNSAALFTSTNGIGDAGNIVIVAGDRVLFDDGAAFSSVSPSATGKGGNVQISTNTLEVTNGAVLSSQTAGTGDAGNIVIVAGDRVLFNDGVAFSNVSSRAVGKGGNVQVSTNSLEVANGGQLGAFTAGTGDAGNILVNAAKTVNISGTAPLTGDSSGLFTSALPSSSVDVGKGGDIIVNTQAFRLADGAVLDADTYANNRSGNITVNAATVDILNGGQMLAITEGKGQAGDITVNATEGVTIAGIDPTFSERLAKFPNRVFSLTPNSGIFVRSQASGGAGEINVTAPTMQLNQGILSAESATVDGGNINLSVPDILLFRNGSLISATAGTAQQGGNGGNIKLDTSFIVAVPKEDSDITANAFKGRGGNINITAQGIFGIEFRPRQTPLSDITASSDFGVNGVVDINTPDVDPARGLTNLPTEPVDASNQIAQICPTGEKAIQNQFIITGRGGLPDDPNQMLYTDTVWTDLRLPSQRRETRSNSAEAELTTNSKAVPLMEATAWVMNDKGQVVLTASAPAVTPQSPELMPPTCPIP